MSTPTSAKTGSKPSSSKKSLLVTLKISSDSLTRFPASPESSDNPSASIKIDPSPSVQPDDSTEKSPEDNDTPAAEGTDSNSLAPPRGDGKKKRGGGQVAGRKRAPPSIDPNGPAKEKGRPGPKKKPRLPDGTIDRTQDPLKKGPAAGANAAAAHKLGPKANTGAINAGLRALDRSGKPCRKWDRKGLQIKSFTGTLWGTSSWGAPPRDASFSGDVKSDTTGSSDVMKPNESSAVASERSQSAVDGGERMDTTVMESSPAPPVAAA